jgi:putative DNA primase/helicase
MNVQAPMMFDSDMYRASLAYYGLPQNYSHTFGLVQKTNRETGEPLYNKKGEPDTTLMSRKAAYESSHGHAVWIQVNSPRESTKTKKGYPKKAENSDIQKLANVPLDFEYPQEPAKALRIGTALAHYLEQQGLAEPGLPVENSGGGAHIVLPLPPIEITADTAERWNEAVRVVVKSHIEPEFLRMVKQEQIEMDLCGFDISRVLSAPGTWRPTNPKKPDCPQLQQGFLRCWLPPYTDGVYPVRKESAKLAELIREAFATVKESHQRKGSQIPSQWLANYAAKHQNTDRSALFQSLVNATNLRFGEPMVWQLKEDINQLSGGKYDGRLDAEITRSLNGAGSGNGTRPPTTDFDLCSFDADDAGNSDALNALYGQDFLYCASLGWLHYTGTHWGLDVDGVEVRRRAIQVLRLRRHAAVDAEKEAIVKCTKADERRVNGCVNLFKTHVSTDIEIFDGDPAKLNCHNGVVDLRTGEISAHSRRQRFTYCVPVAYEHDADYTEWTDYLSGVVGGGQAVIDYLQMALGYSLTGDTREEILFYLFGPPRSGKGTLAEVFRALLPHPLSKMVDFNSFTARREGDVSNFDLAPLKPARLIFASESNRSQTLNPAKIKQLTGGDDINACFKHRDFFSYRPQFKVWMMSNHPVNGDPEDDALWGRVRVIEFPNSFLGREDKGKKARLKEPHILQGILYWTIQGAIQWYSLGPQGLITPEAVATLTRAQRAELDFVQQWLDECTEKGDWTPNDVIMESYTTWCKNNNVQHTKGPKVLAQSLKAKGYEVSQVKYLDGKHKRGVGGLKVFKVES